MNLTKLFHFNYLKQNLKKSRVTLSFVLLILPILNLLIFFMQIESTRINVFSLNELSPLTTVGLYIIPIILSIILFHYVFKKKSIDFIGSMPLDRKTIFVTNTIGGILLIASLIFITAFLAFLVSLFLPNVYVPFGVLLDYFTLFTLSYIFVFVVCNLALSLCGNIPTTIVVTALILFLLPFLHLVNISSDNMYDNIYYECESCSEEKYLSGIYEEPNFHYTTPTQSLTNILTYNQDSSLYKDSALGKMALMTVLYMLIGFSIFNKKELEVSETSFKSKWIHTIVKSLTLVPFMLVVYQLFEESISFVAILFVLALLLVYYFVYDLITKKSITNIRFNLVAFLVTIIILFPFSAIILNSFTSTNEVVLTRDDITSVTFLDADISSIRELGGTFTTTNKKIIDYVLSSDTSNYENYVAEANIYAKGKKYIKAILLNDEDIEKLDNLVRATKEYKNKKENLLKNIDVVTVGRNITKLEVDDIEVLRRAVENPSVEKNEFFLPLNVYSYKNHELTKQTYYSNLNEKLNQLAVDRYNKIAKEKLENNDFNNIRWINIEDEYTGKYYYYNTNKEYPILLDLLKKQTTSVKEKLYKFEISSDDKIYYYYSNLDSDAKKMLELDEVSLSTKEEAIEVYVN